MWLARNRDGLDWEYLGESFDGGTVTLRWLDDHPDTFTLPSDVFDLLFRLLPAPTKTETDFTASPVPARGGFEPALPDSPLALELARVTGS